MSEKITESGNEGKLLVGSPEEAKFESNRTAAVEALGYTIESKDGTYMTLTKDGYTIELCHSAVPSKFGYKGGKISKLTIGINNKIVVCWDRGWGTEDENAEHDDEEETALTGVDAEAIVIFRELVEVLN